MGATVILAGCARSTLIAIALVCPKSMARLFTTTLTSGTIPPTLPFQYGWTALHYAASHDHTEIVQALVAAGADKDAKDSVSYHSWTLHLSNGLASSVRLKLMSSWDFLHALYTYYWESFEAQWCSQAGTLADWVDSFARRGSQWPR